MVIATATAITSPIVQTDERQRIITKRAEGIPTSQKIRRLVLHPLVYFYSRTGTFQPVAFFAAIKLIEKYAATKKLVDFTRVRANFEDYLLTHRDGMSIIIHRLGSGTRSLTWMQSYFERVLEGLWSGASIDDIRDGFAGEREWQFITQSSGPRSSHDEPKPGNSFNQNTKSAAIIEGLKGATRCGICAGYIHRNSLEIDHKTHKRARGFATLDNAQVAHPYCNAMKDEIAIPDASLFATEED